MNRRTRTSGVTVGDRFFMIAVGVVVVSVWVCAGWLAYPDSFISLQAVTVERASERELAVPAGAQLQEFNTEGLVISAHDIHPGGPGKDDIPSLVEPSVVPVSQAGFLDAEDRVIGVTIGGESRAYPVNVLNWHEVINDRVGEGGVPIAVIYCPLCDSVSVVERRMHGRVYEFGVSGLLYNSNVLLYDRTDQALWSQVGMEALSGPNAGRSLMHVNQWELTTWRQWKRAHPESTVVSYDTGHRRDYGMNPYARYFYTHRVIFPVEYSDDRMRNKDAVIGVRVGELSRAYPLAALRDVPGGRVRDVVGGEAIEFDIDPESGAVRIVRAPEGAGVVHTFWFAWVGFYPDTEMYER